MFKYALDLPYPSISNLDINTEYGQILLSNLGGLHSKMNTVTLYFYNSIILNDYSELKKVMLEISKVEMHHLKIIADMCYFLGVDPRLWECQNDCLEYWSPGFNIYPRQLQHMLENCIIQEQNTISNYNHQIKIIKEPIICDMLNRIILDEQLHVEIFQHYLNQHLNKTE
jgi:bacterioferritin